MGHAKKPSDFSVLYPGEAEKEIANLQVDLKIARQQVKRLSARRGEYELTFDARKPYRFAIVADWHIGSLWHNREALLAFYTYAVRRRVCDFFCPGDLLEGYKMRPGHELELSPDGIGYAAQLDLLTSTAKKLPAGTRTFFVTGNHDYSFRRLSGADVGADIARMCPSLQCIGEDRGDVMIETPSRTLRVSLLHPRDRGGAYAYSYRVQKIIEAWAGGEKPDILIVGHYHKALMLPRYRNVKAFLAGTFQEQTPFFATNALTADVGGWIIEINPGELANSIRSEFVEFYK